MSVLQLEYLVVFLLALLVLGVVIIVWRRSKRGPEITKIGPHLYRGKDPMLHKEQVDEIKRDALAFLEQKRGEASPLVGQFMSMLRPANKNHATRKPRYKKSCHLLDMTMLNQVIEVDTEKMVAKLEPLVEMEYLVSALRPAGVMVPIIPELRGITVGGAIQGLGVESSSFVHGLFDNLVLEVEVLTGTGEVLTCTKEENSDLFYSLAGSFGSIGYVLSATVRLIPVPQFVEVTYTRHNNMEEGIKAFDALCREGKSFAASCPDQLVCLESVVYDENTIVTMEGRGVNSSDVPLRKHKWWWSQWFWSHALKVTEETQVYSDRYDLDSYLFRHDRGIFFLALLFIRNTWVHRFLLGWVFTEKRVHWVNYIIPAYHDKENWRVVQDVGIPLCDLPDAMKYCRSKINVYPMWICPVRVIEDDRKIFAADAVVKKDEYVLDLGIYGAPRPLPDGRAHQTRKYDGAALVRELEEYVESLGGFKALFAKCYYSREEFWRTYDKSLYDQVRQKYGSDFAFKDIYDKITS